MNHTDCPDFLEIVFKVILPERKQHEQQFTDIQLFHELTGFSPRIDRIFSTATSQQYLKGKGLGFRVEILRVRLGAQGFKVQGEFGGQGLVFWAQGIEFSKNHFFFKGLEFRICCDFLILEVGDLMLEVNFFSVTPHGPICFGATRYQQINHKPKCFISFEMYFIPFGILFYFF